MAVCKKVEWFDKNCPGLCFLGLKTRGTAMKQVPTLFKYRCIWIQPEINWCWPLCCTLKVGLSHRNFQGEALPFAAGQVNKDFIYKIIYTIRVHIHTGMYTHVMSRPKLFFELFSKGLRRTKERFSSRFSPLFSLFQKLPWTCMYVSVILQLHVHVLNRSLFKKN